MRYICIVTRCMKIFRFVVGLALSIAVVVGIAFAAVSMPKRACSGFDIRINYDGMYPNVEEKDVLQIIDSENAHFVGTAMKNINLELVKEKLQENPYIKTIDEVRFTGTKMKIQITLKQILLHVYTQNNGQFFIDETGEMLPFSLSVKENLFIANGNINDNYVKGKNISNSKSNLNRVFTIAKCIQDNDFYTAQFRQLYVNNHNEVVLIPTVGRHFVLFGNEKLAEEKLFNLQQTYQQGLAYMDMDKYSMLDVRYKNRVIAKKRQ